MLVHENAEITTPWCGHHYIVIDKLVNTVTLVTMTWSWTLQLSSLPWHGLEKQFYHGSDHAMAW
jgi:hypothetical protein